MDEIVASAATYLQILSAEKSVEVNRNIGRCKQKETIGWKHHDEASLKVNVDGATFGDIEAEWGVVIRYNQGVAVRLGFYKLRIQV